MSPTGAATFRSSRPPGPARPRWSPSGSPTCSPRDCPPVDRGFHLHRARGPRAQGPDRAPRRASARSRRRWTRSAACSSGRSTRTASAFSSSTCRATRPTTSSTTTSSRRSCRGRQRDSRSRELDRRSDSSPPSPRSYRASRSSRTSCSIRLACRSRSGSSCSPTTTPWSATGCSPTDSRSFARFESWNVPSWPRDARRLRHLIVDEYQDVNPAQERLVELLAGSGAELCVVGDDSQAIYQWRGSDVGNIVTSRSATRQWRRSRSRPIVAAARRSSTSQTRSRSRSRSGSTRR